MKSKMRNVLTGGNGLLGGAFSKLRSDIKYVDREDFDITDYDQMKSYFETNGFDLMVHCAAIASPPLIDKEPLKAIETNIIGTANVVKLCMEHDARLIYICTDYVFRGDKGNYKEDDPVFPVNKYAWSKLGGECAVRLYDKSLIIRTTFGPDVFPYEQAFVDQWTSRESVSTIAKKIVALIDQKDLYGVIHVGGIRRTVYEFAKSLDESGDIGELSSDDVNFQVPKDTSLDCTKYEKMFFGK